MITHEFRTPLTQIDGQAQRLINTRDRLQGQDLVERATRIRSAVARIIRLIDSLVDTARLVDGDASLFFHPEPLDLVALLHDVCRLHRDIAPGVQILEVQGTSPLPAYGDPKLLAQAFGNLMSNAIKYSGTGAQITVRATRTCDTTSVTIEDEGIGISEEDRALIFTRYYRGRNASGFVGTGLGLFLVATVAHLHGGEVMVESEVGKGARFTLTLPNRPVPGARQTEAARTPLTSGVSCSGDRAAG
jgi:signal transduction histidine kinase